MHYCSGQFTSPGEWWSVWIASRADQCHQCWHHPPRFHPRQLQWCGTRPVWGRIYLPLSVPQCQSGHRGEQMKNMKASLKWGPTAPHPPLNNYTLIHKANSVSNMVLQQCQFTIIITTAKHQKDWNSAWKHSWQLCTRSHFYQPGVGIQHIQTTTG